MSYLFTSEAVSEGHPDKICDAVSDSLLDFYLSQDPNARTAIEAVATTNRVILSGEVSAATAFSPEQIEQCVRKCIKNIGYEQDTFNWQTVAIENYLHTQSADIALGVDKCGAGDQGIMFGYAKKEGNFATDYMPMAIFLANRILQNLSLARHNQEIEGLEPDAKSQVTVAYENGIPVGIKNILVSTQHQEKLSQSDVREIVKPYIAKSLPEDWMPDDSNILINPTGRFVIGGPNGDTGLTGRKIIVDTYGGYAPHGGGAFSGKDPSKVDRSAAYMLRYLAKNVVASGLADECTLQLAYAIGIKEPLSFYINCNQTAKVPEEKILQQLQAMFDLTPYGIITHLGLKKPIYQRTSSYGHFGRQPQSDGSFSWEKIDFSKELKQCF